MWDLLWDVLLWYLVASGVVTVLYMVWGTLHERQKDRDRRRRAWTVRPMDTRQNVRIWRA